MRRYAKTDFDKNSKEIKGESKYDIGQGIVDKRKIFDFVPLEFIRQKNFNALEAEDACFLKRYYVDSLAAAMKANGLTPQTAGLPQNQKVLAQIKTYATKAFHRKWRKQKSNK